MVFYFTSAEGHTIYMGRDKFENEELIRHGFLEDIWFHVDDLSSAHVYLRLPMGKSALDDISEACLEECAQLVKENSIEGSKKKSVDVIYTKWRNLKKTQSMEVGQVGFNHPERVRKYKVGEKDRDILKALNRTKVEKTPDLEEERRQRELLYKAERKKQRQLVEAAEKKTKEEFKQQKELRSYASLMTRDKIESGEKLEASADLSSVNAYEDDFIYQQLLMTTTTTDDAAPAPLSADPALEQRIQHCLRVLEGKSDEHKFAGLLMVAKLADLSPARLQLVRRQVLAVVGARFFLRLLHTRGADADAQDSLSSFQTLGLNLIASFCSDAEVAEQFADDKLVKFLLGVLETSSSTAQAQQARDDSIAILAGVARTTKGKHLLLGERVLDQLIDAPRALRELATSETDTVAANDATTATLAAFWSLVGQLATDPEFWTKLRTTDVAEFVCSAFERAGGAESIAVLAILNQFMALVADEKVPFAVLLPHLDSVREGVLRFLRSKWPHQERDECLKFIQELMKRAGTEWMLAPASEGSAGTVSSGKFVLVVLKLVSIEIKLMLDDVELALVQMEEQKVEHVEETERQEREVERVLRMLPVCFDIVEMTIGALVACLGDDDDTEGDMNASALTGVPIDVLLELKQSFSQAFAVILEFLMLAREYMKTHRYRALKESGAASVVQLDAIVFASVRVVSAWIAEDSDSCMAQLVELVPFLVLYEPLGDAAAPLEREPLDSDDDEPDSDDEVDEADANGAAASLGATSIDQLHFLLPGLLQISATAEGAAALTEDVAVLRRLLRFCCSLCSAVDASGIPTLTLSLGMLVNLLLEKADGAVSSSARHVSEWRRALSFLMPLACASGSAVMADSTLAADERRGEDDRFVMLLHALCVVLLIAGLRPTSTSGLRRAPPPLAKLVAPFNATLKWVARHPPSVESDAATDLFELVRILSLRTQVTPETMT